MLIAHSLLLFYTIIRFNLIILLIIYSHAPDDNEMIEFIQNPSTEVNDGTNQSESSVSDDTITDRQQQVK
jgi:hypothetical protein